MKLHQLTQSQVLPISLEEAWDFFSSPLNLEKITSDDVGFKILSISGDTIHPGQIISYKITVPPGVPLTWVTEITHVDPMKSFVDDQRFGPYSMWHHKHSFREVEGGTEVSDLVHYALPFYPFGEIAHGAFVRPQLEKIFASRKEMLAERFDR